MNKFATALGIVLAGLTAGCLDEGTGKSGSTGPLLRWHHAGRSALAQATNATTLKQIDSLPATEALRGQIAGNFAKAALKVWKKDLPSGAADPTAFLQPLLQDILTAEALIEVRGPVGGAETAVAVEVNAARAALWSTNLWQLASVWKLGAPQPITTEGFAGWELKRSVAPKLLQFFRAGQWVILGLGQEKLTLVPAMLQRTRQSQRPVAALNGPLLDVQADLPGLRPWIPLLADFPLPPAHLTMTGRGENVRTEVRLQYPGKLTVPFETWKIPTNLVGEPLGSFTVARGVAPWLGRVKGLKELGVKPLPNQFCAWGITNEMCRIFFTVPVPDATNAIRQLAPTLPQFAFNRLDKPLGQFVYKSNRAEVAWTALPFIHPFIRAARGPASEFILGGMFFLSPKNYPAPAELYAQFMDRANMLYYDWELTDSRVDHAKQLYDLASIVSERQPPSQTGTASRRWLLAAGPRLRDSVTEITQSGPQELLLVRKSSIGLTGFELVSLSMWLDSPAFPAGIQMPPIFGSGKTNGATRAAVAPHPKP